MKEKKKQKGGTKGKPEEDTRQRGKTKMTAGRKHRGNKDGETEARAVSGRERWEERQQQQQQHHALCSATAL